MMPEASLLVKKHRHYWLRGGEQTPLRCAVLHLMIVREEMGMGGSLGLNPTGKDTMHRLTITWRRPPEERSFTVFVSTQENIAVIHSATYDLDRGNLLLVKMDAAWTPHVTQIGERLGRTDSGKVILAVFRSLVSEDPDVQNAYMNESLPPENRIRPKCETP